MFLAAFGWKAALIFTGSGILLGTLLGMRLGRFRLERFPEHWVKKILENNVTSAEAEKRSLSLKDRLRETSAKARGIIKGTALYVVTGVGIGAGQHSLIPENFIKEYL